MPTRTGPRASDLVLEFAHGSVGVPRRAVYRRACLHTELTLDTLEMAIWPRRADDLGRLVHHSDRGVQYLAILYTDRLADAKAVSSVGSKGDSYDNALAESANGPYKTELINRHGPWRMVDEVELGMSFPRRRSIGSIS